MSSAMVASASYLMRREGLRGGPLCPPQGEIIRAELALRPSILRAATVADPGSTPEHGQGTFPVRALRTRTPKPRASTPRHSLKGAMPEVPCSHRPARVTGRCDQPVRGRSSAVRSSRAQDAPPVK